jgi:leucyl-tRNA synthetase
MTKVSSLLHQVSTLLLAPICPHTCEHVWRNLLRRRGSALTAGWPAAPPPDVALRAAAQYLDALEHTARAPALRPWGVLTVPIGE